MTAWWLVEKTGEELDSGLRRNDEDDPSPQWRVHYHDQERSTTMNYLITRKCGRLTASSAFDAAGGGSGGAFSAENIIPCPFSCA